MRLKQIFDIIQRYKKMIPVSDAYLRDMEDEIEDYELSLDFINDISEIVGNCREEPLEDIKERLYELVEIEKKYNLITNKDKIKDQIIEKIDDLKEVLEEV